MISIQSIVIVGLVFLVVSISFKIMFNSNQNNEEHQEEYDNDDFNQSNFGLVENKQDEKTFITGKASWVDSKTGKETDLFGIKVTIKDNKE